MKNLKKFEGFLRKKKKELDKKLKDSDKYHSKHKKELDSISDMLNVFKGEDPGIRLTGDDMKNYQ